MKLFHVALVLSATLLSACVATQKSTPINWTNQNQGIEVIKQLPNSLPQQSAQVSDSQYVMIQSQGGSMILGPLLGSMNIEANTKRMAGKLKGHFINVDPYEISQKRILAKTNFSSSSPSYTLKPFVFIQDSYDEKFRLSLVYHLEGSGWTGRYSYHLPTSYTKAQFLDPSDGIIAQYKNEMAKGADKLTQLLHDDISGNLNANGTKADIGSLYFQGSKVGGLGIYTMPEEIHFPGTDLVEEGDEYVIVRRQGNMEATVIGGGLIFGVHYFHKDQLHTFVKM